MHAPLLEASLGRPPPWPQPSLVCSLSSLSHIKGVGARGSEYKGRVGERQRHRGENRVAGAQGHLPLGTLSSEAAYDVPHLLGGPMLLS